MTATVSHRTRERIRWHCRRGLLELDLVLNAFLERHLEELDAAGIEGLTSLLARGDLELFDLVMRRIDTARPHERAVLALIRRATCSPMQHSIEV